MGAQRYTTERAVGFEHGAVTVPEINEILRELMSRDPVTDEPSDAMVVVQANGTARTHYPSVGRFSLSFSSLDAYVADWIRHLEAGRGLFTAEERSRGIARFKAWHSTYAEVA